MVIGLEWLSLLTPCNSCECQCIMDRRLRESSAVPIWASAGSLQKKSPLPVRSLPTCILLLGSRSSIHRATELTSSMGVNKVRLYAYICESTLAHAHMQTLSPSGRTPRAEHSAS